MALKDIARSWLMNLPEESVSSWEDLCQQFVANFKPTADRHSTLNDMRQIRQEKGETLYQFMQRFSKVRNTIPMISQANIISAFTEGVTDLRMREKLAMHDELESTTELFAMADKCAKAEAGRLFIRDQLEARSMPSSSKGKSFSKDTKRKTVAVLAAEPHQKFQRGAEGENAGANGRSFCTCHRKSGHSTDNCYEIQKIREERDSQRKVKHSDGHSGGRGGGRGGGNWNSDRSRGNN
jgi:hypothetical protein